MKITKKIREEAIEALLCAFDARQFGHYSLLDLNRLSERWSKRACALAAITYNGFNLVSFKDDVLEAAALLRDGWSPGDPVVRIDGAP